MSLTEHFVPILLSFYIGAWSDRKDGKIKKQMFKRLFRFGRKPFLALCMAGKLLGATGNFLGGM